MLTSLFLVMAGTSDSPAARARVGRVRRRVARVASRSESKRRVAPSPESLIFDICYCLAGSGDLTRVLHFVVEPAWARLGE